MLTKSTPASSQLIAALALTLCSGLASPAAHAKSVGHYHTTLQSSQAMGAWNDVALALMGWSCTGSQILTFHEVLTDHRGRAREVPQTSNSNFTYSAFSMNSPVQMDFERNMVLTNSRLAMNVRENCTKTETRTTTNAQGETQTESTTKQAWMEWSCDTRNLPQYPGQRVQTRCMPSSSHFGDYALESLLVNAYRQKTFDLTLDLLRIEEQFVYSNCSANDPNRTVINLRGGVGGHTGENDFVFHVTINGRDRFDLASNHGLLDDEISYCGGTNDLSIAITATEVDLMFDDQYVATSEVRFSRSGPNTETQRIGLQRRTYFGELFTDRGSQIIVSKRNASH